MKDVKPDPTVTHEIAAEALRIAIAQCDSNVGVAIHNRYGRSMQSQDAFRAWRDAVGVEYDQLKAEVSQGERNADTRAVAALLAAIASGNRDAEYEAVTILDVRFADRIAKLDSK